MDFRVGISGWTYSPWKKTFYPPNLRAREELRYASSKLNTIEINGTFYRLQRPDSYKKWFDETPNDFVFSVKVNRYITHIKRLNEVEGAVANFFASGPLLLKNKLGPLLWQFPPNFSFDHELFEKFLKLLPPHTKSLAKMARKHEPMMAGKAFTRALVQKSMRHAIEVRHASFKCNDFVKLAKKYSVAIVVADTAGKWPLIEEITSDFMYVRLHGDKKIYVSGYTRKALRHWAKKIKTWAKHKGIKAIYTYFDNDVKVRAPYDAMRLFKLLR